MTQHTIAVIGECMIELSQRGEEMHRGMGGDTLNTAVYLARQAGPGLQVDYVTALGDDSFSSQMLSSWQREGLHTGLIQRLPGKLPGLYVIETDARGERTFHYWRSEAAARYWLDGEQTDAICRQLAHYDALYLSGISLAILSPASRDKLYALLRQCRENGGRVIFDNNYRPRLWQSREDAQQAYRTVLGLTDLAFLTLDDEVLLWGESDADAVIARTRAAGVGEVVIKRGADACLIACGDGDVENVAAQRVAADQVVDTTAAGDSFSAGYLAVRLHGGSSRAAAENGHRLAATVIRHRGAIIPQEAMPARADV